MVYTHFQLLSLVGDHVLLDSIGKCDADLPRRLSICWSSESARSVAVTYMPAFDTQQCHKDFHLSPGHTYHVSRTIKFSVQLICSKVLTCRRKSEWNTASFNVSRSPRPIIVVCWSKPRLFPSPCLRLYATLQIVMTCARSQLACLVITKLGCFHVDIVPVTMCFVHTSFAH